MDRFYYNLINLRQNNNLDGIENIVEEEMKNIDDIDCMCKVVSTNIYNSLKENGYNCRIINTKDLYSDMYEHQFIITSFISKNDINYLLIDPTYPQFIGYYPDNILSKINKKLRDDLLTEQSVLINDKDISDYISAIRMSETEISIDDLMLERKIK